MILHARGAVLALCLTATVVATARAQEKAPSVWAAATGTGLILLPDASTLGPRRVLIGASLDNKDRDPLGVDVMDGFVTATVGLPRRFQLEARAVLSRVVSIPEPPPLPAPPVDLVVLGRVAVPETRHTLYTPAPYVDKRGRDRFDEWVKGDAVVGLKRQVTGARGPRPALAATGELTFPLARSLGDLRSGSGTGGVDAALRATAEWRLGRASALLSIRYTRTGAARLPDQVLRVDASGAVEVTPEPLRVPDRLEAGAGARVPLSSRWAVVVEAETTHDAGARTRSLDPSRSADLRAGLQARLGLLRVVAALRYHVHSLASGERRASPLAGMVDLTDVDGPALSDWLAAIGAAAAGPRLRAGSHRVAAGAPDVPLPRGARRLPAEYRVRSEHQTGFTIACLFAF